MLGFSNTRKWVYPLRMPGLFSRIHKFTSLALVAFLVLVPWIRIGGEPLFLADVGARRLIAFGNIFTASDGVLILISALLAAFGLFFFTSIFGRLWCGYTCPQSVFMINLVFPVDEWLEGPRALRAKRDAGPWTFDKAWRKVAKWTIFAVFAIFVSMSFMGFFAPTELLWTGQASATQYSIVGFFSALWFIDFAWYREQVCNYICPYARFQGALTDKHSLVISYDETRGEPRGKAARERGGCIDCNKCVVVCPQGIDIRDGYQLECIACGKCIDACTSVMERIGHPTLVRYSTEAADAGEPRRSLLRGRTVAYGGLLAVLLAAFIGVVATHSPIEVQVDRAPGSLFVEDADGYVRNTYLVHVTDRQRGSDARVYVVAVQGLPEGSQVRARPLSLSRSERGHVPVIVRVPRDQAERTVPLTVTVRGEGVEVAARTTFKGPGN